jgi:hypothetical protein
MTRVSGMNPRSLLSLVLTLCIGISNTLFAQGGMGGGLGEMPGMAPLFLKLLAGNAGFRADCFVRVNEASDKGETTLETRYEYAPGKMRVQLDLSKMKSPEMSAEVAAQLSQMGMGEMIALNFIEKKESFVVYPGLKAYAKMPMKQTITSEQIEEKMESTDLGQETIDGIPCTKKKAVFKNNGKTQDVLLWIAKSLKDFPLQIQTKEEGSSVTILFKNVKLEVPGAERFAVPAGYTAYTNIQQMVQQEMMKKMSGGM